MKKARSETFSKVYSTNVLVSETDSDVRLYGFNEIINTGKDEKIAICDGQFIMTDQATIVLYEQLKALVERWESAGKNVEISENRRNILKELLDGF